jgi:hypothetical protein
MSGGVFLVQNDGMVEMREARYDTELVLQELLAQYPSLLAGDQVNPQAPRRWLLIRREAGVPDADGAPDRWSLDHLFLDQEGVPTLVEVKRSSDTRIRREVVGQMLDYASNALAFWPVESIRANFESRCADEDLDPEQVLAEFLDADCESQKLWSDVKTNLEAGRIRLVFVADEIPAELQRIIEFLNGQMSSAEVLGVAIRQYAGGSQRIYVPRVIGRTATAARRKSGGEDARRQWDEESFFADLRSRRGNAEAQVAARILRWSVDHGLRIRWGKGGKDGSFFPEADAGGRRSQTVAVWTYGRVNIQFEEIIKLPVFQNVDVRAELQTRLNGIPGVQIPDNRLHLRPSIDLAVLAKGNATDDFVTALDWMVERIRAGNT